MRLLVTGGAGFIDANVALGVAGLEHHLSRGDYRRRDVPPSGPLAEQRMRPSRCLTKSHTH